MGLVALAAAPVRAEYEFTAHSAEPYGSAGYCGGDALTNANEDALYLDNGMSGYDQLVYQTNLLNDLRDFADSGNHANGDDNLDPTGTDFADVVFYSGHGGASCTSGSERIWMTPGDSTDGCTIYPTHATSSSRHVTFGGTTAGEDAEIFVTFSCNTTQYCVYTASSDPFAGMSAAGGQFNQLNGFHGDVAEVSGYQSDMGSFSNDAIYNGVGDAWMDWMYHPDVGGGADNCPSVIGWGANTSETDDYFTYSGWLDLHNNGSRGTDKFYRLCGCDPIDGAALPSC
jgi:hypothetical protein